MRAWASHEDYHPACLRHLTFPRDTTKHVTLALPSRAPRLKEKKICDKTVQHCDPRITHQRRCVSNRDQRSVLKLVTFELCLQRTRSGLANEQDGKVPNSKEREEHG